MRRLLPNPHGRTSTTVSTHRRFARRRAPDGEFVDRARSILEESGTNGDFQLVAAVLARRDANDPVAIVSDDRRIRTITRGLGARVTGTVVVRAVEEGMSAEDGKAIVRRLDEGGLHMTGELRETADGLIEDAAE